ncbi:alpha-L-arabinofuranosidase C-terminal domain-containing protein [Paenibacillus abyssi]|uniref:non-reducing end alpha-L-arabinofuranosidase n=1 Tax=Paenibacillus abyssi TaxID=1340531 RepID=A0A917G089_9BACL|nr:alpha-L-arabinofuranosidase C-terminal domain-containing protein [Paenibacillus abyssi]GGG15997.1 alpha-N-arabinofuranosidase [Paenibacillus abyssi]
MKEIQVNIDPERVTWRRDPRIYGHFIEHFHNQIYGGIYNPQSPLSDDEGFRTDVLEAWRRIQPPVVRWPGGCFVSAYHWTDGIGPERQPHFDKAWRVEDTNEFGTDEFIALCRKLDTEPYICTNAGTGTAEEMSDWVEYCNLRTEGKWAKRRIVNGSVEPHNVTYWSIGNENYLPGEMGAKTPAEWGRFVKESAKMMKRVDPSIELFAASVADLDWNIHLLREAGPFLDWLSIHGYWDPLWQNNRLSDYEACMLFSTRIEAQIEKTRHILGAMGYLGKIRVAFDEWNLRGWHHPNVDKAIDPKDYIEPRDLNDLDDTYTMADALFSACFFNQCLKHSDLIGMANYAPSVNTRGLIRTHEDGIVLRPTYHVFDMYVNGLGDQVVDSWIQGNAVFKVEQGKESVEVPVLDVIATIVEATGEVRIALVNRHPEDTVTALLKTRDGRRSVLSWQGLSGDDKNAYNDKNNPERVKPSAMTGWEADDQGIRITLPPHSVHIIGL